MKSPERIRRPTSNDVARLAGVSQTTVSLIVRGVEHVAISPETRERVLRAIEQLDYEPHEAARSLKSRSSRIIGMMIPEPYSSHHIEIAAAAEAYAKSQGYDLFLSFANYDVEKERQSLQWLKQQRYDGLILLSRNEAILHQEIRTLHQRGYVITIFGFFDPEIDSVDAETTEGEEQLLQHLVALGHRKIGYIFGVADQIVLGRRLVSCLAIQQRLGIPVIERYIRRCGPGIVDGYQATKDLLAECPEDDRPTALIVVNDLLANGTLRALYEAGLQVPQDVSIASFDNTLFSTYSILPLTTVDIEASKLGAGAARITIQRLAEPNRPPEFVQTKASLIVRASTGPVRR